MFNKNRIRNDGLFAPICFGGGGEGGGGGGDNDRQGRVDVVDGRNPSGGVNTGVAGTRGSIRDGERAPAGGVVSVDGRAVAAGALGGSRGGVLGAVAGGLIGGIATAEIEK